MGARAGESGVRAGVETGWRDEFLEGVAGGAGLEVVQSRLVAFSACMVGDLMSMWTVT